MSLAVGHRVASAFAHISLQADAGVKDCVQIHGSVSWSDTMADAWTSNGDQSTTFHKDKRHSRVHGCVRHAAQGENVGQVLRHGAGGPGSRVVSRATEPPPEWKELRRGASAFS